jgi:predicted alpha/beta-fold hydrolase
MVIKPRPPSYRRERWTTPDGDFIDLDWVDAPPGTPLVVLFHGLEGSSASHYAASLMAALRRIGWAGVVAHFRGCSGEPNRLPRAYHSGDTEEIDWILHRLAQANPERTLFAVGVSLGGNALAKWLGERAEAAARIVAAAAVVSAPFDLTLCGHHLERGFNRVYTERFLVTLRRTAQEKLARYPGLFDAARLRAVRSLYDFDDLITAPLHGFAGAADYWRRASAKPFLGGIRVPTLLLNARNDPFLPAHGLPAPKELSRQVTAEFPRQGGHVGFVTGRPPGRLEWLPQRLLHWFAAQPPFMD